MKNALYFDCYSGVAGDMLLGALIDLDLDRDLWRKSLRALAVEDYHIRFRRVVRQAISARKVDVRIEAKQPHRHLKDIEKIIAQSDLARKVQDNALKTFRLLAQAEAKIHDTSVEKIHFHEVGAVDAIVDIVGACIALEQLEITEVYCSPVGVGKGLSRCDHGPMPLPPPATLEILQDCPLHFHDVETELATPTGAALLKVLASFQTPPPHLTLKKVGYGAGSREIPGLPNVLRAVLLRSEESDVADRAVLLETNIDDMNPEVYPHVIARLLEQGAMDAYLMPIIMKKGRPGVILSVLCPPALEDRVIDTIYRETTTLGIRISRVERLKLPRRELVIHTSLGDIRGKEAAWKDQLRVTPEYEDCRRIAAERAIPLHDVYKAFHAALEKSSRSRKRK